MTFRQGDRVRIDGGQYHGLTGTYVRKHGACAHIVSLSGWGCVDVYRVLPLTANNGD